MISNASISFFEFIILLLTHAQCYDVLIEAGTIILMLLVDYTGSSNVSSNVSYFIAGFMAEADPNNFTAAYVGDNRTFWRRRNLRNRTSVNIS